jgi:hypothetical protein
MRAEPLHPGLAAVLLTASALMCVADHLPPSARAALVVGYLLLAPGCAVLPFPGRRHWLLHALLVVSFGTALAVGLATLMAVAGRWHVEAAVSLTWVLVVAAVGWRTWRNRSALVLLAGGIR